MDSRLDSAVLISVGAADLLCHYFHNVELDPGYKADDFLVTEADLASDHFLVEQISSLDPGAFILSEELNTRYPLEAGDSPASIWVIDPLDGTTNFSLGLHYWGVLIAHLAGGRPDLAVLNFPILDELYTAQRGQGAQLNGKPIHVEPPDPQLKSSFFSCCSRTFQRYEVRVPYKLRVLGSTGYSLCCLARGISLVAFDASPKIWDIAGGWLLVEEAGGAIEAFNGAAPFPLQPGQDYASLDLPFLAAATPALLTNSRDKILPR